MEKRVIMRIEVEPRAKRGLDDYCDQIGMTKVAAVSRLIEWFCDQPEGVQGMIQGLIPTIIKMDVAEIVLKQLAATKFGGNGSEGNGHRARGGSNGNGRDGVKTGSKSRFA
jgi:hypothetical protein